MKRSTIIFSLATLLGCTVRMPVPVPTPISVVVPSASPAIADEDITVYSGSAHVLGSTVTKIEHQKANFAAGSQPSSEHTDLVFTTSFGTDPTAIAYYEFPVPPSCTVNNVNPTYTYDCHVETNDTSTSPSHKVCMRGAVIIVSDPRGVGTTTPFADVAQVPFPPVSTVDLVWDTDGNGDLTFEGEAQTSVSTLGSFFPAPFGQSCTVAGGCANLPAQFYLWKDNSITGCSNPIPDATKVIRVSSCHIHCS